MTIIPLTYSDKQRGHVSPKYTFQAWARGRQSARRLRSIA
jgi:hypothetical protein